MRAAAGVEPRLAGGTSVLALQILANAHLDAACSAQHSPLIPFRHRPDLDRVPGQDIVAVLAGIVGHTTPHLDGDDVERAVVVDAAGLGVEIDAEDRPCGHEAVGELPPWNRPNIRADITAIMRTPTPTAIT